MTVTGHKIGGPIGVGRAGAGPRPSPSRRCCTAAGRSATCAPAPSTPRRSSASRRRPSWPSSAGPSAPSELAGLRDDLVARVRDAVPDAVLGGDRGSTQHRLPGNAHFSFPGCEGDALLLLLDARGIECSTGSACSAGVAQPSHVLLAMGVPEDAGPRLAALLARAHLDRRPTSTPSSRRIGPVVERARRAGQTTSASPAADEGARRDVAAASTPRSPPPARPRPATT